MLLFKERKGKRREEKDKINRKKAVTGAEVMTEVRKETRRTRKRRRRRIKEIRRRRTGKRKKIRKGEEAVRELAEVTKLT